MKPVVAGADQPAVLAHELMGTDSTSGQEGAVITLAERLLRERAWEVTRIPVSPGRHALLARAGDGIDVTLTTHLDTVPPYIPPRMEAGVLYGRGACDAKGIAASMMVAAARLRERGVRVALAFVVGEETTHDGAKAVNTWMAANLPPAERVLINGEPTENTLALGTKGALRVLVRAEGRAAHSAYPHLGRSAIDLLVRKLAELGALQLPVDDLLGETTVNIGMIAGGVADNVVAPWAEARLMARIVTSADDVYPIFQRWAGDTLTVERGVTVPPVRLGRLDGFATSVAAYATDIPQLTNLGRPYLLGPGSIHVAHTMDEHVVVRELEHAVDLYEQLALGALAQRS